jgi:hypothetical protein
MAKQEKHSGFRPGWLLLMHQLPSRPAYLRVKVWRTLREAGAIALRHSGYVLPLNDRAVAVMRQTVGEIERGKGKAALCEAKFLDGVSDDDLRDLFNKARDADYAGLESGLRKIASARPGRQGDIRVKLEKAAQRLKIIAEIDFFGANGRGRVESLLSRLEHSFIVRKGPAAAAMEVLKSAEGKVWVTRRNIHVDRIACAWLIRRFIDPRAQLKFVSDKRYRGLPGELRFDMTGAEFTHEGDNCSFETILNRFSLTDPALRAIGEIIHDLDLKDGKFHRAETSGIGHIIDGITLTQRNDLDRVGRGASLLDDVYEQFRSRQ